MDVQVDFFVRQLEQQHEAAQPRLTPQVRNRRLAQLNRLIEEGVDFLLSPVAVTFSFPQSHQLTCDCMLDRCCMMLDGI